MKNLKTGIFPFLLIGSVLFLSSFTRTSFSTLPRVVHCTSMDDGETLRKKWDEALGSFQFQIVNSRISPKVDISIIETIESKRDEKNIIFIPYAENIRIKILPKSMISGNFEKLDLFIYITE